MYSIIIMPYNGRYYKGRKGYRRSVRRIYRTGKRLQRMAAKTARRVVKQYVNTEYKHYDVQEINQDMEGISSNAQTVCLNNIPQGDSDEDRNGSQCKIKSVMVKGVIKGDINQDNKCRVQIWLFTDPNGSLPANSAIYDYDDSGGSALNAATYINANRKLENTSRYKLLKSFTCVCEKNGKQKFSFSLIHKFPKGLITKWDEDDTTGAVTNMRKGMLFFRWESDQTTANFPTLNYVSRVRYIDN